MPKFWRLMKKSLLVMAIMTFFNINMHAGILDTIADYVHDYPLKWDGQAVKKIVVNHIAGNKKAIEQSKLLEKVLTVGAVVPSAATALPLVLPFVLFSKISGGDSKGVHHRTPDQEEDRDAKIGLAVLGAIFVGFATLATYPLVILVPLMVVISISATSGMLGLIGAAGYTGYNAFIAAKYKANDIYYNRLLNRLDALVDNPDVHVSIMDKFKSLYALNSEIQYKGFSLILRAKRTALKAKIRKELGNLLRDKKAKYAQHASRMTLARRSA